MTISWLNAVRQRPSTSRRWPQRPDRLVGDHELRLRMGAAGRAGLASFSPGRESSVHMRNCGASQEAERCARASSCARESRWRGAAGPAAYPSPEQTFAGYPTRRLDAADRVAAGARQRRAPRSHCWRCR